MAQKDSQDTAVQPDLAEVFDIAFAGWAKSATLRDLWRQAYGAEYPETADPTSFVTLTDLRRIARELRIGAEQTFVDLACGRGGPGLWVARETGAALIGVDFSKVAIAHAVRAALEAGLEERARFQVGDFSATGLPSASFDGAMSVDALWIVADKPAALREVARILRPGARFIFTTWDMEIVPPGLPPQVKDHHALLKESGFAIEAYEETARWESYQRGLYENIDKHQAALRAEMGEVAAGLLLAESQLLRGLSDGTDYLKRMRRILVVARLP